MLGLLRGPSTVVSASITSAIYQKTLLTFPPPPPDHAVQVRVLLGERSSEQKVLGHIPGKGRHSAIDSHWCCVTVEEIAWQGP